MYQWALRQLSLLQVQGKHSRMQEPSVATLGLGVQELSIAAGTGADVMVGGNAAAPALLERHSPLNGMLRAAATHVGKLPDCSRLGLGALEIFWCHGICGFF